MTIKDQLASPAVKDPARRRVVRLQTLWSRYWAAAGPPADGSAAADSRAARLLYIESVLGRPVASANDLSPSELAQVNRRLDADLRAQNRETNKGAATREQIFAVRALERRLGWHTRPERLSGFLQAQFRAASPERLSHGQASKAIEALYAALARVQVKARMGPDYPVGKPELAREVSFLKRQNLSTL